jgi:hypothetical protein
VGVHTETRSVTIAGAPDIAGPFRQRLARASPSFARAFSELLAGVR